MRSTMKKRVSSVLAFVLTISLLLMLAPSASAAMVTSTLSFATGTDQSGDGYDWNGTTKTLTLTNFSQQSNAASPLTIPGGSVIVLSGTNTITSTYNDNGTYSTTIYVSGTGALTIQGSGTLELTGGTINSGNGTSYGIYSPNAAITIKTGATVIARSGISTGKSYGAYSPNTITVEKGAVLEAYAANASGASDSYSAGVCATIDVYGTLVAYGAVSNSNRSYGVSMYSFGVGFRAFIGSSVDVKGYNGAINGSNMGFNPLAATVSTTYNGALTKGGTLSVVGSARYQDLYLNSTSLVLHLSISPLNKTLDFRESILVSLASGNGDSGSYTWSGSTLTLNGFQYTTADNIAVQLPANSTVVVNSDCVLKSMGYGLFASDALTVQGDGSLDITGEMYGIYTSEALSINIAGITVRGGFQALQGTSITLSNPAAGYFRASENVDGSGFVREDGIDASGNTLKAGGITAKYFAITPYYDMVENVAISDPRDVDVQAKITWSGGAAYKIDIAWGPMTFTYSTSDAWNPNTHAYDGGPINDWLPEGFDGENNRVTAWNHSNGDVLVSFDVTQIHVAGVSMAMNDTNFESGAAATNLALGKVPIEEADAESVDAFLYLSGTPDNAEAMRTQNYTKIAVITVTVTAAGGELTPQNP